MNMEVIMVQLVLAAVVLVVIMLLQKMQFKIQDQAEEAKDLVDLEL